MKKLLIAITLIFILSACNIPMEASPTPDVVATIVSKALTEAPTNTPIILTQPVVVTATPVPTLEPTATAVPSEEPTATAVPTQEPTATAVPTEAPTATAVPTEAPTQAPTATLAPTATATLSPEDPAVRFGNPTYAYNFSTISTGWDYEDDQVKVELADGKLNIISKGKPYWNSWYTVSPELKNFYIESTLTMVNCSGGDRIGLAFRLDDDEFYFMGITCDGRWGFSRYTEDDYVVDLLDYAQSAQFNLAGQPNRVGVLANGKDFEFYVNGVKVGSASDDTLSDSGSYGFVSMSLGTVDMKTSVDNLKYWQLP